MLLELRLIIERLHSRGIEIVETTRPPGFEIAAGPYRFRREFFPTTTLKEIEAELDLWLLAAVESLRKSHTP